MIRTYRLTKRVLPTVAIVALSAAPSYAAGTSAGTTVNNTFTLDYTVGGVGQTTVTNSGSPTQFTVDRLVDLTVESIADNDPVAPGATGEELIFSLSNTGNDTQAYDVTLFNETTDDFNPDALTFTYYVDDGDGLYEPGADDGVPITYNGTNTVDVPADRILWIRVTGDIPAAQADGTEAAVTVIADTLEPSTSPNAGDEVLPDADSTNTILGVAENVLADGAGTANENPNEGDHSDTGKYVVGSADLSASKTAEIRSMDGSGCTNFAALAFPDEQYSIPGACMSYVISAVNSGSADATNIDLSDTLNDNLTFAAATAINFSAGAFGNPVLPASNTDCTGGACVISFENGVIDAGQTAFIRINAWVK